MGAVALRHPVLSALGAALALAGSIGCATTPAPAPAVIAAPEPAPAACPLAGTLDLSGDIDGQLRALSGEAGSVLLVLGPRVFAVPCAEAALGGGADGAALGGGAGDAALGGGAGDAALGGGSGDAALGGGAGGAALGGGSDGAALAGGANLPTCEPTENDFGFRFNLREGSLAELYDGVQSWKVIGGDPSYEEFERDRQVR